MSQRIVPALSVVLVLAAVLSPAPGLRAAFVRGDVDASGKMNLADAVHVFRHLFLGAAVDCADAVDANDDGALDATDGIHVISYVFLNGAPPAPPFPDCGDDPTDEDPWSCDRFDACPSTGDGVFFVIDRSGSSRGTGALARAKTLAIETITEFSPGVQFGVVFSDQGVMKFPAAGKPAVASPENKQAAIDWIATVGAGGGSCIGSGLITAVDFADSSTSRRNVITYMGDGGATCPGHASTEYQNLVLSWLRERNVEKHRIDAIAIGTPGDVNETFLKQLVGEHGGTFSLVAP